MFKPTEQQLDCISKAKDNKAVFIEAVSGASKTTTLCLIAKEIVKPTLYLAFNKVTAKEASEKFPNHVSSRTTHSIAYEACGMEIAHKLKRPTTHYTNVAGTGSEIAKMYKLKPVFMDERCVLTSAALGLFVKSTVAVFEQSSDAYLGEKHVVYDKKTPNYVKANILKAAKQLWLDRINPSSKVLATHDTYLKLFQLSKPVLEYSVIMVDEFQDSTECVLDIIKNQAHAKVIVVGDSRQAIYQWRGSVNGFNSFKGVGATLSKSFRFGQAIADVANATLGMKDFVQGFEEVNSEIVSSSIVESGDESGYPKTIIFRTNTGLLTAAVDLIESGMKVNLEVDVKDYVSLVNSVIALKAMDMGKVKHEKVIPFEDYDALKAEAKEDKELDRIANLIESGRAMRSIALLENHVNVNNYEVLLTTAHKSKGREWDIVVLAEDFPNPFDKAGKYVGLNEMETNLLYVAETRAKKKLKLNATAITIVEYFKRKYSYLTPAEISGTIQSS